MYADFPLNYCQSARLNHSSHPASWLSHFQENTAHTGMPFVPEKVLKMTLLAWPDEKEKPTYQKDVVKLPWHSNS